MTRRLSNDPQLKAHAKREREQILLDTYAVLATPEGERFIGRLLAQCGVFRSSMTGNSNTFFLEGQRSIGLQLITDILASNPAALGRLLLQQDLETDEVTNYE